MMPPIVIEISSGELLDRLSILHIKSERIVEESKLRNIRADVAALTVIRERQIPQSEMVTTLAARLREVHEHLWDMVDSMRRCEANELFDEDFVALARSVYLLNDQRHTLKRQIDTFLGAERTEEKSFIRLTKELVKKW